MYLVAVLWMHVPLVGTPSVLIEYSILISMAYHQICTVAHQSTYVCAHTTKYHAWCANDTNRLSLSNLVICRLLRTAAMSRHCKSLFITSHSRLPTRMAALHCIVRHMEVVIKRQASLIVLPGSGQWLSC